MKIGIDFDGTCVTHEYPHIGKEIGAADVLKKLVDAGHQLILVTMRGQGSGLEEAVDWFERNGIPLYGINKDPDQGSWTDSPKAYAQLYIDDAGIGTPLTLNESFSDRPFVNWQVIDQWLEQAGYYEGMVEAPEEQIAPQDLPPGPINL